MIRIKICGITNVRDALIAASAGADYMGFIFSKSPRRITQEQAGVIERNIPQDIERVGVFVNEDEAFIRDAVKKAGLSMIQLHGNESPVFCSRFKLPVIKAIRIKSEEQEEADEIISEYETDYILLEPFVPGKYGGTGITADWPTAGQIVRTFVDKKFFLAGGLNPDNVVSAVDTVRPFAVDAGSGLEDSPGIKSHKKIRQFIEVVKNICY